MTKEDFILNVQEELEFEQTLLPETVLKDSGEWDSMAAMVLIGFVADNFDVTLTGDNLKEITTINSLIEKIGVEKFD